MKITIAHMHTLNPGEKTGRARRTFDVETAFGWDAFSADEIAQAEDAALAVVRRSFADDLEGCGPLFESGPAAPYEIAGVDLEAGVEIPDRLLDDDTLGGAPAWLAGAFGLYQAAQAFGAGSALLYEARTGEDLAYLGSAMVRKSVGFVPTLEAFGERLLAADFASKVLQAPGMSRGFLDEGAQRRGVGTKLVDLVRAELDLGAYAERAEREGRFVLIRQTDPGREAGFYVFEGRARR